MVLLSVKGIFGGGRGERADGVEFLHGIIYKTSLNYPIQKIQNQLGKTKPFNAAVVSLLDIGLPEERSPLA